MRNYRDGEGPPRSLKYLFQSVCYANERKVCRVGWNWDLPCESLWKHLVEQNELSSEARMFSNYTRGTRAYNVSNKSEAPVHRFVTHIGSGYNLHGSRPPCPPSPRLYALIATYSDSSIVLASTLTNLFSRRIDTESVGNDFAVLFRRIRAEGELYMHVLGN